MNITSAHKRVLILEGPILVTRIHSEASVPGPTLCYWWEIFAACHHNCWLRQGHRWWPAPDNTSASHPGTKVMRLKNSIDWAWPLCNVSIRLSLLLTCFHLIFKYLSRAVIGFQSETYNFSPVSSWLASHGLIDPDNMSTSSHWWLESVKYGNLLIAPSRSWMSCHHMELINTQHSFATEFLFQTEEEKLKIILYACCQKYQNELFVL